MGKRNKKTIFYKTKDEIELMRHSNLLVSKTHAAVVPFMRPGVATKKLDKIAETFIKDNGALPGFKGIGGFPATLCISVNDAIVHGLPSDYELKDGDIVSIDCGVLANGFYGDSAYTYSIGEIDEQKRRLLTVTKEALYLGIEQAVTGKRIGDIGFAIQQHAERKHGFGVVRKLVGHGVGRNLHEAPEVPNYGKKGRGVKLLEGLVLAIEPMINMGSKEVRILKDEFTFATEDGLPSAHFEHTVAVGKDSADILSSFEIIEKAIASNKELSEIV